MSPELIVAAIVASLLVGAITAYRARRTNAALLAEHHRTNRIRTADQVRDDVRDWKSERNRRQCEALWALPVHIPQQRKET